MAQRGIIGMTVIVLAGGPKDELARTTPGAANKAFVRVAGVALVERTLRALRSSASVGRIIVVAPPSAHGHPALALADERRPDGVKIRDSLRSGLSGLPPDEDVLVSTSDLPVLTAAAVDDFVARANDKDASVVYGCLEKKTHLAAYPDVPHTWARFADGTYCGGGLMTLRPRAWPSLERFIEQLGHARKHPLQLASLFGWDVLLRFALRRLTIAQAEERASRIVGVKVRAAISPYAQTAVNVDRLSDIRIAERLVL